MLRDLVGDNEVRVVADCRYSVTGEGMHRFVDPVDGETYLYTQFEVPDARRVFACFDQPDLKARFRFTVTTPAGWRAIGNVEAERVESGDRVVHRFDRTPPVPTYVACVIAGPYERVQDVYIGPNRRRLPLGLYCRRSVRQFLDAGDLFETTRQGLDFFHEMFGIAYPFGKHDQVFVPEFHTYGMENAAAVTIRDEDLFRSRVTDRESEERADTILHEMAHMWFGNLVTMTWWDDLWLNESFATLMATTCRAEMAGSRWPGAWTTFTDSMKDKAYEQDQLPTTHPIVAEIGDVSEVLANIDGITYEKGASVLRQLMAYVGRDSFEAGLRDYMSRHAWGNTRLRDLLAALEKASDRDLGRWSGAWLETAGVNVLRLRTADPGEGAPGAVVVEQEAPDLPAEAAGTAVLRPHRIAIGSYDLVGGRLVRTERVEVDVDGPATVVPMPAGRPAVLLPNDDDLTYAKVRLDEASWAVVRARIGDFADSLPRALCWSIAWDMTRDGDFAARSYLPMVLAGLRTETEIGLLRTQQRRLRTALLQYADPSWRADGATRYAEEALVRAAEADPGTDHQLAWVEAFVAMAATAEHVAVLHRLLAGEHGLAGLEVSDDLRWTILERLCATGSVDESMVDAELARDGTADGARRHLSCLSARPTPEAKTAAWETVVGRAELPGAQLAAVIAGFSQPDQHELLAPYVARYFAVIDDVFTHQSPETRKQIVTGLYPHTQIDQSTLDATDEWLARPQRPPLLRRMVLEGRDGIARAMRARAADRQGSISRRRSASAC